MKKIASLVVISTLLLSGCATVPLESAEAAAQAKQFNPPSPDRAGIYVYRDNTPVGAALKKNIWINGECIGESAKGVFFYHEVAGNGEQKVSTESEFSPNDLFISTEGGNLYFVRQYLKLGVVVGGANLEQKSAAAGKAAVAKLDMARKGACN